MIIQQIEQLHHILGAFFIQLDVIGGPPFKLGAFSRAEAGFQRITHRGEILNTGGDFMPVFSAFHILGAGFNRGVLTTEMKINFLAPAAGDRIIARGKVLKAGRTLSLVQTEIFTVTAGQEKLIAFLTATFMSIENRDGIED